MNTRFYLINISNWYFVFKEIHKSETSKAGFWFYTFRREVCLFVFDCPVTAFMNYEYGSSQEVDHGLFNYRYDGGAKEERRRNTARHL